ncbi:MAG: hypothetical protein H7Z14_16990, partial [Anaerolineae bacterium]|nr:hypothetical protein [Phycisphaerae bacterium]
VIFRALIFALGVLSIYTAEGKLNPENAAGTPWVAWDGIHYVDLVHHGYAPDMTHPRFSLIAYFPMLPMVARPLAMFMPATTALVLIANLCAIVGFGFLYSWAKQLAGHRIAIICVLLLSTYPGAVFFSAALTEGPFFMLATMTLWLLQREKYWPAAIVAAIATALRPTGVALAAVVPIYYFFQHPQLPFGKRAAMFVVLGFVSCLGGLLYEAFIWQRYKVPDAYVRAQHEWELVDKEMVRQGADEGMQRYSLHFFLDRAGRPQAWNRIVALALVIITIIGFFKPGPIPRMFFVVPLLIFLMTYIPNHGLRSSSIFRYETGGVPVFLLATIWLAQLKRRGVLIVLLSIQLLMQCYYAILFSRGSWVG